MDLKNEQIVAIIKALPIFLGASVVFIIVWLFMTRPQVPAESDTYRIEYDPRSKTYTVEFSDKFDEQSQEEKLEDYAEIYDTVEDLDGTGNLDLPGDVRRAMPQVAEEQQKEEDLITSQPYFEERLQVFNEMTYNHRE